MFLSIRWIVSYHKNKTGRREGGEAELYTMSQACERLERGYGATIFNDLSIR